MSHPRSTRSTLCLWALTASLAGCSTRPTEPIKSKPSSVIMDPKQDQLIKKIGLDTLPSGSAEKGVQAPWTKDFVAAALQAGGVAGPSLLTETTSPMAPGEAWRKWIWSTTRSPNARLLVNVYVSSTGPAIARARLIKSTTETMLSDVPDVAGPADLGDASAFFDGPPSFARIAWVFQNVCVTVSKQDDTDSNVLTIAHAMQTALAQHVVDPLTPAIPKVDRVDLSAAEVRVNEPLTVRIRMGGADPQRRFLVSLSAPPEDVRVRDASLNLQLTADNPGNKALTILIVDASTLLSTTAQATMIVKR
ncbi:MAG: hypothetical protein ABJE95_25165 [Byssovorax sp.]